MGWFGPPNEADVQAKMQRIEQMRQIGGIMDPSEMDEAGQEALRRLMKGGKVQPGQPIQQPSRPPAPPPQAAPPQAAAGQPPPQGPAANVTPQQGGVWADAEAEQKRRAMSGAPTVR